MSDKYEKRIEALEKEVEHHFKLLYNFLLVGTIIIVVFSIFSYAGLDLGGLTLVAVILYYVSMLMINKWIDSKLNKKGGEKPNADSRTINS